MRALLFSILLLLSIQLHCQHKSKNYFSPKHSTILAPDKGEFFLSTISKNNTDYFIPTNDEIFLLENNFKKIEQMKSTGGGLIGAKILPLKNYAYQYVGIVINNRRYIYINAFIVADENDLTSWYKDWETEPIVVFDGGNGFWCILFNLDQQTFSKLGINGVA